MVTLLRSLLLFAAVLGADIASAQGRTLNVLLLDGTDVALSESTGEVDTSFLSTVDITASVTDITSTFTDKTFDSGVAEVWTVNFADTASTGQSDFWAGGLSTGETFAVWLDKGTEVPPTGATYVAALHKARVDISGTTNDEDIGLAVKTTLDSEAPFPTLFTIVDNEDGTVTFTSIGDGPLTTWTRHNAGESGNGSLALTEATAGVAGEVDLTNNVVTIPAHAYPTGMKLQLTTTGTLPTGVTTSTDYYVIAASSSTIGFASTQALALAGTKIDLTGYGAGVGTVAVEDTIAGTIKLQKNNEPKGATAVWFDITNSSQNITTTANLNWALTDVGYRSLRAVVAITEGVADVDLRLNAKQ